VRLRACISPGVEVRGVRAPGCIVPRASRGPSSTDDGHAMKKARHQNVDRQHATPQPFPIWFKIFFAAAVGGLALLIAVAVAVLTVI
jgi:hypothetical protein